MENTIITTHERLPSLMQDTSDNYQFLLSRMYCAPQYAQNQ